MRKLTIALLSVLALSSSFAFAEDGSDRVQARSAEHMKSAMAAHNEKQTQSSNEQTSQD